MTASTAGPRGASDFSQSQSQSHSQGGGVGVVKLQASTFVAGFPGMDTWPSQKTAGGSGGEHTLRHRVFPFHDLPADGDPHRSMLRPATGALAEQDRQAHKQKANIINAAYVADPPAFTRPPPPRPTSELDTLMQPDTFRDAPVNPRQYSTTHQPRHKIASTDASADPHQAYYEQVYRPASASASAASSTAAAAAAAPSAPGTARGTKPPLPYDSSRAGFHSQDANRLATSHRGIKIVPRIFYTDSADYHTRGPSGGVMVADAQEKAALRAAMDGRPGAAAQLADAGSAGLRVEKRPGSKSIAPQNLSLRQSTQVAALLCNSEASATAAASDESALRSSRAVKLNAAMRQRDWGQHAGYDIITLAGAGGQNGQGAVHAPPPEWRDPSRAGVTSRQQDQRLAGSTFHSGTHHARNHASSLNNQCFPVGGDGHSSDRWTPQHRPLVADKNASNAVWDVLQGR